MHTIHHASRRIIRSKVHASICDWRCIQPNVIIALLLMMMLRDEIWLRHHTVSLLRHVWSITHHVLLIEELLRIEWIHGLVHARTLFIDLLV